MKIYTKTGDSGDTALFGGRRVSKEHPRIEAYGTVDELNAFLGQIVAICQDEAIAGSLQRVQGQLFVVGADLATPMQARTSYISRMDASFGQQLEAEMDAWQAKLPQLTQFILPGGGPAGAGLHVARTICRRAERRVVNLAQQEAINQEVVIYLNRLSDWLFVLARYVNHIQNMPEKAWQPE
jgi:cob(I)alamin adenosyltransferase